MACIEQTKNIVKNGKANKTVTHPSGQPTVEQPQQVIRGKNRARRQPGKAARQVSGYERARHACGCFGRLDLFCIDPRAKVPYSYSWQNKNKTWYA